MFIIKNNFCKFLKRYYNLLKFSVKELVYVPSCKLSESFHSIWVRTIFKHFEHLKIQMTECGIWE